jgi:cytochrome b561
MKERHAVLAWLLAILAGLHVAAALKHHFVDRDGLLDRMRPGR